jgi:hypothetical protein
MTLIFIAGDGKEYVITTPIIGAYNGEGSGGGASHKLIAINIPLYE